MYHSTSAYSQTAVSWRLHICCVMVSVRVFCLIQEVEALKASSKRHVEKLNRYVDKSNHYMSGYTSGQAEMEKLREQLKVIQERSGEEIARLSNVAKGLEKDKELLALQVEMLVKRCRQLEAGKDPGPAAPHEHALGQNGNLLEQHAQLELPPAQLLPASAAQVAATMGAAGPQPLPPPSAVVGSGLAPRPVQDPRRRPPATAAAAPAAALETHDLLLSMFRYPAQAPASIAAVARSASPAAFPLSSHQPGSAAAAAPADAGMAPHRALPGLSGHHPGSATAAVMALERRSSAPSQGGGQTPDRARSNLAVMGVPAGTPDGLERTRTTADMNLPECLQPRSEEAHRPLPPAGLVVPQIELPPHLTRGGVPHTWSSYYDVTWR